MKSKQLITILFHFVLILLVSCTGTPNSPNQVKTYGNAEGIEGKHFAEIDIYCDKTLQNETANKYLVICKVGVGFDANGNQNFPEVIAGTEVTFQVPIVLNGKPVITTLPTQNSLVAKYIIEFANSDMAKLLFSAKVIKDGNEDIIKSVEVFPLTAVTYGLRGAPSLLTYEPLSSQLSDVNLNIDALKLGFKSRVTGNYNPVPASISSSCKINSGPNQGDILFASGPFIFLNTDFGFKLFAGSPNPALINNLVHPFGVSFLSTKIQTEILSPLILSCAKNLVILDRNNNRILTVSYLGSNLKVLTTGPEIKDAIEVLAFNEQVYFISNNNIYSVVDGKIASFADLNSLAFESDYKIKALGMSEQGILFVAASRWNESGSYFESALVKVNANKTVSRFPWPFAGLNFNANVGKIEIDKETGLPTMGAVYKDTFDGMFESPEMKSVVVKFRMINDEITSNITILRSCINCSGVNQSEEDKTNFQYSKGDKYYFIRMGQLLRATENNGSVYLVQGISVNAGFWFDHNYLTNAIISGRVGGVVSLKNPTANNIAIAANSDVGVSILRPSDNQYKRLSQSGGKFVAVGSKNYTNNITVATSQTIYELDSTQSSNQGHHYILSVSPASGSITAMATCKSAPNIYYAKGSKIYELTGVQESAFITDLEGVLGQQADVISLTSNFPGQIYALIKNQIFSIKKNNDGNYETKKIAGSFEPGNSGDNGPALDAHFNNPTSIVSDTGRYIWVADAGNASIRVLKPQNGTSNIFNIYTAFGGSSYSFCSSSVSKVSKTNQLIENFISEASKALCIARVTALDVYMTAEGSERELTIVQSLNGQVNSSNELSTVTVMKIPKKY